MPGFDPADIRALVFDVFGTVVDWRGSLIREGEALERETGVAADWAAFADDWRRQYQPQMQRVRSGELGWTKLDVLHRNGLEAIASRYSLDRLPPARLDDLVYAWHRLDPWPDAVEGLTRLKRRFVIATCSNGNVALMVNMAKRAGLPWDAILGAEVTRHYKPDPECYLGTVDYLGLAPGEVLMVAAHNGDLKAAASCGLRTAFVPRPTEHGPGQKRDLTADAAVDVAAADFIDLAARLGA